jgi:hypothetical protein
MAFHIEIRSGYQRARAFNLAAEEVRERILVPWLAERRIELGDQAWDPRDSHITVLEGPTLAPADLNYGRGWDAALKRSADVTAAALEAVQGSAPARPAGGIAVLAADTPAARQAREELVARLDLAPLDWSAVRSRVLARAAVVAPGPPDATAVLAILDGAPGGQLALDLGLALGAFGGRTVIVAAGGAAEVGAALPGIALLDAAATEAIAERLRVVHRTGA